jgi:hypothetical protein
MGLVGFGQPDDGVIQMCYLVPDIQAAMQTWVQKLRVGPWFLLDHFTGTDPQYRGQDSKADVSLAMSFAGHMNIELIQPNDEHPSVYREWIDRKGYGFHHWGRTTRDFTGTWPGIKTPDMIWFFWPECLRAGASRTRTPPLCCPVPRTHRTRRGLRAAVQ